MGPMPAHYRDDSVRDVQDTPAAFAAVAVTLLISIGLPLCLTMQGKTKKPRRPPADKQQKGAEEQVPHISRKERRGERENRDLQCTPQTADIAAVTTTEDTGVHSLSNTLNKKPAITKVSGPWSPEEEAELIKAVAKFPGGTIDRWAKIADLVGTRGEEDCMARAAALKGIAHHRTPGGGGAGGAGGGLKADARSAYTAGATAGAGGAKGGGGSSGATREDLAKLSVTEFAKLVKEKEREKLEREREREREKEKDRSKDRQKQSAVAEKSGDQTEERPWTAAEQSLLEHAMRTVDKSLADRWDRIAEMVPNRSRKEIVARVKELKKMLAGSAQEPPGQ
jgi:DnaJ family protein C protein 1